MLLGAPEAPSLSLPLDPVLTVLLKSGVYHHSHTQVERNTVQRWWSITVSSVFSWQVEDEERVLQSTLHLPCSLQEEQLWVLLQDQVWCDTVKQGERTSEQSQNQESKIEGSCSLWSCVVASKLKSVPMNKLIGFSELLCTCSSLCQWKQEFPGSQDKAKLEKCKFLILKARKVILSSWQSVALTLDGSEW